VIRVNGASDILTINSNIQNNASASPLTKTGAGTLIIGGTETYTGTTYIANGTLKVTGPSVLPITTALSIAAGGTFDLNGNDITIASLSSPTFGGTVALGANTLTISGGSGTFAGTVTSSGGVLRAQGSGTVTLASVNSLGSAPLVIGDGTTFSGNGVGGVVSVNSQNALGIGDVTINYGGSLSHPNGFAFVPTNIITVNAGGTFNASYSANNAVYGSAAGTLIVRSMATLVQSANCVFQVMGNTFPTKGVLILANNGNRLFIGDSVQSQPYPTLTGTMVFNQVGTVVNANGVFFGPFNTGTAQTIAFNNAILLVSGLVFNGTTLGGNLTIAGSGNTGLTGLVPNTVAAGNLGTVTQSGGNRSLIIAMAPAGAVTLANTATGYQGGLTVKGGTIIATAVGGTGANTFGGGTVTLDGGAIRQQLDADSTIRDNITVTANGGALEAIMAQNTSRTHTFSGNISGSGPVVLRYYMSNAGKYRLLGLSGTNSSFIGGFTLAALRTNGAVLFTGDNSTGAAGNVITAPAGTTFGFDNATTYANTISKFSASPDAILFLENLTATAINLSAGGVNKNIRLGNLDTLTYTGTITPYASTYNITPRLGNLTIGNASPQFTSSYALDVQAPAAPYGAMENTPAGTLLIAVAQDYSGATTVSGTVRHALMGTAGVDGVTLSLGTSGELTNTSAITINNSSTFTLASGSNTGAIGADLTVKGNSTINVNCASPLRDSVDLILGGFSGVANGTTDGTTTVTFGSTAGMSPGAVISGTNIPTGATIVSVTDATHVVISAAATGSGTNALRISDTGGGTYLSNASGTQILASLKIAAGANTVNPNAGGKLTINSGVITRTAPGGTVSITSGNLVLTGNLSNAFLGPWAFVGNTYAATDGSGNVVVYAANTNNINDGTNKRFQNTNGGNFTLSAGNTLDTIDFNVNGNNISVATYALELTKGGIINQSGAARTIDTGTGGTLTSSYNPGDGSRELIINLGSGDLTINPQIVKNNSTNITLTKSGASTLTMAHASNQIGDIYLNGGTLYSTGFHRLGDLSVAKTVYFFGGTLSVYPDTVTPGNNIAGNMSMVVGPQGGTIGVPDSSRTTAYTFSIGTSGSTTLTLNGNLAFSANGPAADWVKINSDISGPGTLSFSSRHDVIYANVELGGSNTNWTGGLLNNTTIGARHFRIAAANATGSGPFVLGGRARGMTFTSGAGASYANDLQIIPNVGFYLQNWKTNGPVSLNGKIIGTPGLVLQGYDAGSGNVSETVLAGTLSMSGTPMAYSYGGSTVMQRFVNAQSGITLGTTDRTTTLTATDFDSGLYAYNSTSALWTDGAEGYVRFAPDTSGKVNSLIPGAVGPGYVAAIRKGGDSADAKAFGYLITGAKSASGLTGTTTLNSSVVTLSSTVGFAVGQSISGAGIPPNTRIASIASTTSLLLSANATANGSPTDIAISGSGVAYQLPEGKSFVIGTLGAGTAMRTGGTFGAGIADDTDARTVTFMGSPKLAGAPGGDINIHANTATDAASLNVLVRNATDTLTLGVVQTITAASQSGGLATITTTNAHGLAVGQVVTISGVTPNDYNGTYTIAEVPTAVTFKYAVANSPGAGTSFGMVNNSVVFTPTWGDSGATSAITLMRDRTGNTILNKTGAGTLLLNTVAYNNTAGTDVGGKFKWAVNGGVVEINAEADLGTAPGTVVADQLSFNSGTLRVTDNVTFSANRGVTLTGNGTVEVSATKTAVIQGVVTGSGNLTKTGEGTLTLSGANTYVGTTTVSAGTMSVGNIVVSGGSSHIGNASSAVTLGSATTQGILSYTGNTAAYTRGFFIGGAGGGRLDVTTSGQTLTVGTINVTGTGLFTVGGAGNTIISVVIGHTGGLTKEGAGTLTLAAGVTHTYNDATTVNGGTLELAGASDQLNVTSFTMETGTTLKLTGNGANCAKVISTGAVSLNGPTKPQLDLTGLSGTPTETEYILVSSGTGLTGEFSNYANNAPVSWGGKSYKLTYTATQVKLVLAPGGTVIMFK
jgi:autotransporter-associated beta strand protein